MRYRGYELPREESSLEETKQSTAHSEHLPALHKALADHNCTPREGDEGEPVGAADFAQHDVTRQFEQKVRREKHDKCDGVAVSHIQSKIGAHTCNAGICDVGAVDLQCVSEDSAALLEGGSRGR